MKETTYFSPSADDSLFELVMSDSFSLSPIEEKILENGVNLLTSSANK